VKCPFIFCDMRISNVDDVINCIRFPHVKNGCCLIELCSCCLFWCDIDFIAKVLSENYSFGLEEL